MSFWQKLFPHASGLENQLRENISQYSEQEKESILKLHHARMGTLTKVNPNLNPIVLSSSIPLIADAAKDSFQFEKMLEFWFNLAEKDIDPYFAFENTLPAIANRFEKPQDFVLLLDAVGKLVEALSELVTRQGTEIATKHATGQLSPYKANQESMNAKVILRNLHNLGIGAALVQTNIAPESIRDFILYGVHLTNDGIEPTDALGSIPYVIQVAHNANEVETLMALLDKFVHATYKAFPNRERPFYYGIVEIAKNSLDINRLDACLNLACDLIDKKLRPYALLENGLPHILKEAHDENEFRNWIVEGHRMVSEGIDPTEKFLTLFHRSAD